ncbi:MAG: peptidylprolyl isomerase [Alphaproteobacteria bacterium]
MPPLPAPGRRTARAVAPLAFCTLLTLALTAAPPAAAQGGGDPVVATVDREDIRRSDVEATIKMYGAELSKLSPGEQASVALDRLIDAKLVTNAARAQKLHEDATVKRQLVEAERRILQQALLGRVIAAATTEKALKERYEVDYGKGKGLREIRARHILTYTQGEAESVIKALRAGADFGALADERSVDTTSKGGDLGWFSRADMVPAFGKAAFDLKVGEFSKAPVESQFGWHVIKVEEQRTRPAPPFEKVKPELEQRMAEEAVVGLLADLRRKAKIDKRP